MSNLDNENRIKYLKLSSIINTKYKNTIFIARTSKRKTYWE